MSDVPSFRETLYTLWANGVDAEDEILASDIGCSPSTVATYRLDWERLNREGDDLPDGIVEVDEEDLPLETRSGIMWIVPVKRHRSCEKCDMEDLCREAVRYGWFLACERPLEGEMLPEKLERR